MSLDEQDIFDNLVSIETNNAYKHFRPLREAADEFISWASTPEARVYTGINALDQAMRGTAPGELTLIQGFTHSGKTLLVTEMMLNNSHTPFVLFTPDETRPLVLTKLTSALHGVGAEELEQRIQADDETARQLLLDTAEQYGQLAIFDDSVSVVDMDNMFEEVAHAWGCRPRGVIFDYAELLEGPDDVKSKMTALKAWGKRKQTAMFVLHQTSRTSGSGGKKMQIDSGSYGGEQQATHVIGVRRKKYMWLAMISMLEEKVANSSNQKAIEDAQHKIHQITTIDLPRDLDTVTVSLVKNKRPPCNLVDDLDYKIEQDTGRVIRLDEFKDEFGRTVRVEKAKMLDFYRQRSSPEFKQAMTELEGF